MYQSHITGNAVLSWKRVRFARIVAMGIALTSDTSRTARTRWSRFCDFVDPK
jgi:hypothetical protein